jgi:hypothetical protein
MRRPGPRDRRGRGGRVGRRPLRGALGIRRARRSPRHGRRGGRRCQSASTSRRLVPPEAFGLTARSVTPLGARALQADRRFGRRRKPARRPRTAARIPAFRSGPGDAESFRVKDPHEALALRHRGLSRFFRQTLIRFRGRNRRSALEVVQEQARTERASSSRRWGTRLPGSSRDDKGDVGPARSSAVQRWEGYRHADAQSNRRTHGTSQ